MNLHGLPSGVVALMEPLPPGEVCGRCTQCPMGPHGPPETFFCKAGQFETQSKLPDCSAFVEA